MTNQQADYMDERIAALEREKAELLEACNKTLEENLHLADGDNCTLIHLKRAVTRAEGTPPRCLVTGNLVGTDTWMVGAPCHCANCKTAEGTKGEETARRRG